MASAGTSFVSDADLDELLEPYRGASLLTLDSEALADRLRQLPAVADAHVSARLPDELEVTITEKVPAFTWLTVPGAWWSRPMARHRARWRPTPSFRRSWRPSRPSTTSARRAGAWPSGDAIPVVELATAQRLLAIDPTMIGSATTGLTLRIDDEYGFILVSLGPDWTLALGFYQLDPEESQATAKARLDAQLAAVRTLFATQPEAAVSWVDARNPGKVYWAR